MENETTTTREVTNEIVTNLSDNSDHDLLNDMSSTELLDIMGAKLDMLLYTEEGASTVTVAQSQPSNSSLSTNNSNLGNANSTVSTIDDEKKLTTHFVDVALFHKPRGSRGVWQQVRANDRLRVTKNKGKRLKLRSVCEYKFDPNRVDIYTVDVADPLPRRDGISIESIAVSENGFHVLEIELKLFLSLKQFQFSVHVLSEDGKVRLIGNTVIFTTTSSGGTTKRIVFERNPKKRKLSENLKLPAGTIRSESPAVVPSSLDVYGFVRAKAFHQLSDVRLKTNIEDVVDALGIVTQLKGKKYEWLDNTLPSGTSGAKVIGMIAQEVQKVMPELVHKDESSGLLSVSYLELIAILVEALKEHVNQTKIQHNLFQSQLAKLNERINTVEQSKISQKQFRWSLVIIGFLAVLYFLGCLCL